MSAAVSVIASQGLGAPTALIAKTAGVSNGSLFTYFDTKADLFNQLYMELKAEMATAALEGLSIEGDFREQMLHVWSHWVGWAVSCPDKRRTLVLLNVSDDITPASRRAGDQVMARLAKLLDKSRETGPMRDVPLAFVAALMNAIADTATDFMISEPENAEKHCADAFDAFWRIVS